MPSPEITGYDLSSDLAIGGSALIPYEVDQLFRVIHFTDNLKLINLPGDYALPLTHPSCLLPLMIGTATSRLAFGFTGTPYNLLIQVSMLNTLSSECGPWSEHGRCYYGYPLWVPIVASSVFTPRSILTRYDIKEGY